MGSAKGKTEGQRGMALVGVLSILIVLTVSGSLVYHNVRTDITHSGRDLERVKAEFAAESAIQWGLAELACSRPGSQPFTKATHGPDGRTRLPDRLEDGRPNPDKLRREDMASHPRGELGVDREGWFRLSTGRAEDGIAGGRRETLAFKAWYPNDSTLRISGQGTVDGVTADMDLESRLREVPTLR